MPGVLGASCGEHTIARAISRWKSPSAGMVRQRVGGRDLAEGEVALTLGHRDECRCHIPLRERLGTQDDAKSCATRRVSLVRLRGGFREDHEWRSVRARCELITDVLRKPKRNVDAFFRIRTANKIEQCLDAEHLDDLERREYARWTLKVHARVDSLRPLQRSQPD